MSNKDDYHYYSDNELEDAYRDSTFPDNDARDEMERRGYELADNGEFVKKDDLEEEEKTNKRNDDEYEDDDSIYESSDDDELEEASGCFGCFAFLIVVAVFIVVAYILFKAMI